MELTKKNLHQICRKSEAETQITFDEDYNVPDTKPDVGRMIQEHWNFTCCMYQMARCVEFIIWTEH